MAIRVNGKVTRLYVARDGVFIRLDVDSPKPKDDYYKLPLDHTNYNALYSLALAAAANRWPLQIRIAGDADIDPNTEARVNYMVVDWVAGADD